MQHENFTPEQQKIMQERLEHQKELLKGGASFDSKKRLNITEEQFERAESDKDEALFHSEIKYLEPWEIHIAETRTFSEKEIYDLVAEIDGLDQDSFVVDNIVRSRENIPILMLFNLDQKTALSKFGGEVSYEFRLKGDYDNFGVGTVDHTEIWRFVDRTSDSALSAAANLPAGDRADEDSADRIAQYLSGEWVTLPMLMTDSDIPDYGDDAEGSDPADDWKK